jgi:hypothetical protein
MIFLWCALPSPTIPANEREAHISRTLASGRPLITVIDWTEDFNVPGGNRLLGPGQAYITRWQLQQEPHDQGVSLRVGTKEVVNLTDVLAKASSFNADHTGSNMSAWIPFFDEARTYGGIWASDVEFSEICLPWFHSADKHFITHEMHGYRGDMTLRFVVPQRGVLELWLETIGTQHLNMNDYALKSISHEQLRAASESLGEHDRKTGLLATFKSAEMKQVGDVAVVGMQGDLLSRTYPIRRALFGPLAPVFSVTYVAFSLLLEAMSGIVILLLKLSPGPALGCAGIMLSCWLRDGRPDFSQWTRTFWMTRWIPRRASGDAKKVWGPAGPVSAKDAKYLRWDEESAMPQRPPTVRLGRHWKG